MADLTITSATELGNQITVRGTAVQGPVEVSLKYTDSSGNFQQTTPVGVTLNPDKTFSVTITAPAGGRAFKAHVEVAHPAAKTEDVAVVAANPGTAPELEPEEEDEDDPAQLAIGSGATDCA
jgi:ribosomal protein L11